MPSIPGEAISPHAGSGGAYIFGRSGPDALSLLEHGRRARESAAYRAQLAQDKANAERAKQFLDDSKYQQDGSVYFGQALNDKVYQPLTGKLNEVYGQRNLDALGRAQLTRPLLQNTNNETVQSKSKTDYIKGTLSPFQNNPLYNPKYATEHLTKNLPAGTLPSQFDEEAWKANLLGDHNLYNEKEVVTRATKGVVPAVMQKISDAGAIGGLHESNAVKSRFVAYAQGKPLFNADGTPVLNLTGDTQALLEGDPLFKLKVDAREAAYNAKREESVKAHSSDPTVLELPQMSRRGHMAQMLGPLAFYDQTHDEGLNRLPPRPRAAKAGAVEVPYTPPSFGGDETRYNLPNDGPVVTEGFPGVGQPARGVMDVTDASRRGPIERPDYAVYGSPSPSPVDVNKSGKVTNKHVDAWTPGEFDIMAANGKREHRVNSTQPFSGYPGPSHGAFVDAATGKQLYPASRKEGEDLVRAGKAKLRVQFDFNSEKGENFAANLKSTTEALLQEKDSQYNPKYPNRELAEAAARKQLSTGTVRSTHLYTPQNKPDIDRLFGSNYAKHQEILTRETQRLRAEGMKQQPATKTAGGSVYQTPAAPAAKSAVAPATRGGSIYKIK